MKNISSSTGTARKNSTTAQHGHRSQRVVRELADAEHHAEDDREQRSR